MTTEDLVQAVKDYALAHYKDGGWDVIVECWGSEEIEGVLLSVEAQTAEDAIKAFEPLVSIWAERQADAEICASEAL